MKKSNWLTFFLNGLIAILFGIMALFSSQGFIFTFTKYAGLAILILGGFMLLISVRKSKRDMPFILMMIEAVVGLIIGLIMLFFTRQAIEMFAVIIGIWAILMGIFQLVSVIKLWKRLKQKNLLLLISVVAIILGIILFANPFTTVVFLTRLAGFIALIVGILLIYFAWEIYKKPEEVAAT